MSPQRQLVLPAKSAPFHCSSETTTGKFLTLCCRYTLILFGFCWTWLRTQTINGMPDPGKLSIATPWTLTTPWLPHRGLCLSNISCHTVDFVYLVHVILSTEHTTVDTTSQLACWPTVAYSV